MSTQKNMTAIADELVVEINPAEPMLALQLYGTFTSAACAFEARVDPAAPWVPCEAVRSNANTVETATGTLSAAPAYTWDISAGGFAQVRIRCTAIASGSMNWTVNRYPRAEDINPAFGQQGPPSACTMHTLNSAAGTNATSAKNASGHLFTLTLSNNNAAARFFKLYNKASSPTVGTDIPVMVIPIPATGFVNLNFGALGQRFTTGIAYAITGAITDADTTAIGAGEVKVALSFQ